MNKFEFKIGLPPSLFYVGTLFVAYPTAIEKCNSERRTELL